MQFRHLAEVFTRLEATSKRLEMFDILAELFRESQPEDMPPIIYMSQGRLLPAFQGVEMGMSDKLVIRALADATHRQAADILSHYKQSGDLGTTAEALLKDHAGEGLSVADVYEQVLGIARMSGTGSVEQKLRSLARLLRAASPLEAKYIARFVVGRLRLGVGDATVLEALALAKLGDRKFKSDLERAYNLCSDLGRVGRLVSEGGPAAIAAIEVQVGYPIRMMLCERVAQPEDIIQKIGRCAVEPKLDGFRCQIHKNGEQVEIFSRNLERTTAMFPDIVDAVRRQIRAHSMIFEGEALAFDEGTGELLSFQATIQRKRKHDIADTAKEFPLKLFCFDLLYVDDQDYTRRSYVERRKELTARIMPLTPPSPHGGEGKGEGTIEPGEAQEVEDPAQLREIFEGTIGRGLEGIVAKRLDSPYTAGSRNFNWIKLKRSYKGELSDTVDLCLVGYFRGGGKRARFGIGAVLAAVYDSGADMFRTICKVGTGFADEEWIRLRERLDTVAVEHQPARVDSKMVPDVWVQPTYVITVAADEITRSTLHTAGADAQGTGYALRFPRVQGFLRDDKRPEDANTVKDIIELYELQKRVKLE